MEAEVRDLSRDTYGDLVKASERPSVIDFWGQQCAPCLVLAPTFHELADRFADRLGFFRVEAPKNRMLCVDTRVMSLPTFLYVKDGEEVDRLTGDVSPDELTEWIEERYRQETGGDLVDV